MRVILKQGCIDVSLVVLEILTDSIPKFFLSSTIVDREHLTWLFRAKPLSKYPYLCVYEFTISKIHRFL